LLRADLAQAVELGRAGEYEKLDALPVASWMPAARTKLMYLYFPNEVLPIYSLAHFKHYIELLGGKFEQQAGSRTTASANRQLLKMLRAMPELSRPRPRCPGGVGVFHPRRHQGRGNRPRLAACECGVRG